MIRGLSLNLLLCCELLTKFGLNLCFLGIVSILWLVSCGTSRILLAVSVPYERPPVNLFVVGRVHFVEIFEYIPLLLFGAHYIFELLFILLERVAWFGYGDLLVGNSVPVDRVEKGVPLNLVRSVLSSTKTLAWVSVQQMYD